MSEWVKIRRRKRKKHREAGGRVCSDCSYCHSNRFNSEVKRNQSAKEQIEDWKREGED